MNRPEQVLRRRQRAQVHGDIVNGRTADHPTEICNRLSALIENGRSRFVVRGWTSEAATDGVEASFILGEPMLYASDQRVVYFGDKVSLATFAVNETNDVAFHGAIEVALDGTVLANTVLRLPR